ncbi:Putative Kinesin [Rhizopus microsporus]|nr:Putative Kinesin [Rhizopus microsporus]
MGTGSEPYLNSDNQGIIHRFAHSLFGMMKQQTENYKYQVYLSYLELYNEEINDLLVTKNDTEQHPSIREDTQGRIYWANVKEENVQTAEELLRCLKRGSLHRTTGTTELNASSSRSHAIFSVILKQQFLKDEMALKEAVDDNESIKRLVSKFHFVDLAGSERLKKTNALGDRQKEGISINSGLLALGNVISALAERRISTSSSIIPQPHIPYRDSKLTRLLQDSLGGNSNTLMLACVSSSESDYAETLNTLKYANRARNIQNRVEINHEYNEGSADELRYLRTQVARLKMQVSVLSDINSNHTLEDQVKVLKEEMNAIRTYVHSLTNELVQTKSEKDTLALQLNGAQGNIEPHPIIQDYASQVEALKLQVAETQMKFEAANNALNETSLSKRISNSSSTSHLHDLKKHNMKQQHHASTSTGRRLIKRKHSIKIKPIFSPVHRHKKNHQGLENNIDEFIGLLQKEYDKSTDETILHDSVEATLESFLSSSSRQEDFSENNRHMRLPSPPPYICPSPPSGDILFDDEEDRLEALEVPAWSDESKGDLIKRSSISVDSMWDDTDSSITTSYLNSSTADIPTITASTSYNKLKNDRKHNKKLLKMLHQVQADLLVKKELVGQLEKTEDLYTQMRTNYEGKLNELKEHLLEIQKERDAALKQKVAPSAVIPPVRERPQSVMQLRENKQAQELRSQYEVKLKHLIAENQELRKKNTQLTQANRTARVKSDSIIRQLQTDIERLRTQKKQLTKSLKVETDSAREAVIGYEREIQQLKRRELAALDAKSKLEQTNEAQSQMIQKRTEETAAVNAQMRQLVNTLRKASNAGTYLSEANLEKILNGTFTPTPTPARPTKRRSTIIGAGAQAL